MYKILFAWLLVTGLNAADEIRKEVVTIGQTNAGLVVAVIQSKTHRTAEDQHSYLLALYQSGKLNDACRYFLSMDERTIGKRSRLVYVKALLDLGQPKSAFFQLKKMDDPKRPDLQVEVLKAKVYVAVKEWKAARATLSTLVRVDADNAEVQYLYALTCPAVGEYEEAVAACNRVWELVSPGSRLSKLAGALMLVSMKKMGLQAQRDTIDEARKK